MKSATTRNLIKYIGISSPYQGNNCNFKLFDISYLIKLTSLDCNIKNIVQVKCGINIINSKVIKTPSGTSCEGYTLTGNKLFITGIINCTIQYNDYDNSNKIFSHNCNFPFVESIQLPKTYYLNSSVISLSPHIIDISANKIDNKTVCLSLLSYIDANC